MHAIRLHKKASNMDNIIKSSVDLIFSISTGEFLNLQVFLLHSTSIEEEVVKLLACAKCCMGLHASKQPNILW
jgi:hypothetical protein